VLDTPARRMNVREPAADESARGVDIGGYVPKGAAIERFPGGWVISKAASEPFAGWGVVPDPVNPSTIGGCVPIKPANEADIRRSSLYRPANGGASAGFQTAKPANHPAIGGLMLDSARQAAKSPSSTGGVPAHAVHLPARVPLMPRPLPLLLVLAREDLGMNQMKFASLVQSSQRSVQRWESNLAIPAAHHMHLLIDTIAPRAPALAAELAEWAPRPPPVAQHVEAPARVVEHVEPSPVPLRSRVAPQILVDAVVCSAADAVSLLPNAIRPALRAAFARAHEVGLTVEEVMTALSRE